MPGNYSKIQATFTDTQGPNQARGIKDEAVMLTPLNVYIGTVVAVKMPQGVVDVQLNASKPPVSCVHASGIWSSLMGLKTSFVPEVGTDVNVFYVNEDLSFIMGSSPSQEENPLGRNRTIVDGDSFIETEQGQKLQSEGEADYGNPLDIIEGELDLQNIHGVGISLLTNLAKLSAGELAKVECFLLDDMVRIISDKFKHFTCFGDHEIFRDGNKLDVRWLGTHRDHEAWGKELLEDEQAKFNIDETTEDPLNPSEDDEVEGDDYNTTGRWRFHKFIGHLGNFINLFISDPISSLANIADKTAAGKFRAHVNDDGSLLVQSVGDIIFERVVKIPVPVEKKRYDDPETPLPELPPVPPPPLQNWKPTNKDNLFEVAYQIRDYARWFSNKYAMAQFLNDPEHYKVPNDPDIEFPDKDNKDKIKKDQNESYPVETHQAYRFKYSTIRIYRDGSITALNAYGCAVNLAGTDVTVSATRNLNLEAGNHINIVAGQDVLIKARRHVEVSAIVGGILMRCKSWLQNLCEAGTILLESGAGGGGGGEVAPRVIKNSGVVIKSKSSSIYISAFNRLQAICGQSMLFKSALTYFANTLTQFAQFAKIDSQGVTSPQMTASTGKFGDLPCWVYLAPQHTTGFTPIKQQCAPSVSIGANQANSLKQVNETFEYRGSYTEYTDYESLTQQHIRLDSSVVGYGDADSSIETLSSIGKGTPYPGQGVQIKLYNPANPVLTADVTDNRTLKNEPEAFQPTQQTFKYKQ
jgi:hypothetical protein